MHSYRRELDAIKASETYKTRLVAAMTGEQGSPRAPRRKRSAKKLARWLVPVAAVLLLAVLTFSIPSVSRAVSDWFISLLRLERYMEAGRDEADRNPDIEQVITQIDSYDQSYEIRLLDEIPATKYYSYEGIDAGRVKQGQPAFAREDWAFLLDLKPEIRRVLYDGKNLIITTFYGCDDPTPYTRGYLSGSDSGAPSLDILTFDCTIKVNGVEQPNYGYGTSLDFSKWYERSQEPGFSTDEIQREDGGVYGITEFNLPDAPAFPDGLCEIELVQTVQDNLVDNMNVIGMVAQIVHRFSFDTTVGNAGLSARTLEPVKLAGTVPYTVTYWPQSETERGYIQNTTVQLDGATVTPELSYRATGVHVTLHMAYPPESAAALDENLRHAIEQYTDFDLYIDGVFVDRLDAHASPDAPTVEISLTPSELAKIGSIVLKPVVTHYTVIAGQSMKDGAKILLPYSGFFSYDPSETAETPLTGCDIAIPLP